MKTLILAIGLLFAGLPLFAQINCNPNPQNTEPGLYPIPDSLPCFVRNCVCNSILIEFVMFDSTEVSGFKVRVEYIIIEEILNLPCGVKWVTSKANANTPNRFENQESGCILLYGYTDDIAGQYKLDINVRAKINLLPGEVSYNAEDLGFRVDVRVIDSTNSICPSIDTSASADLKIATCVSGNYLPGFDETGCYSVICDGTGIAELSSIDHFTLYPNPANNSATVSFIADKAEAYTSRIVNIYGQEVSHRELDVLTGLNIDQIDVSQLPAGIYIYTLTDGKDVLTQRFVVE